MSDRVSNIPDDDDRAYEAHAAEVLGGIAPVYSWQDDYWNFCPFTGVMAATRDEIPF